LIPPADAFDIDRISTGPAAALGEARVHAEQIGREQGGFLAPRAGADLEDDVLVVVGILGHQQLFERLLQPLLLAAELGLLLARQIAHLRILLHLARLGHALVDIAVQPQRLDQLPDVRVLLAQLLHLLAVRQHGRIGEHRRQLLVAGLDGQELGEQELIQQGGASGRPYTLPTSGRERGGAVPLARGRRLAGIDGRGRGGGLVGLALAGRVLLVEALDAAGCVHELLLPV
jgi:hypothetical protein